MPIVPSKEPSTGFRPFAAHRHRTRVLRLGYVQLSDAAPFMIAEALGFFEKYDLTVELQRELGWATVRDKIVYGELDAAQALAPMPFCATLGMGLPMVRECVAAMVMNTEGDAITLGNHLRSEGVHSEADLRFCAKQRPAGQALTFGVVSLHSTHHILLKTWLKQLGINPATEVRIVVVPPAQMLRNLEAANLDGYCVGEPWNGAAVFRKTGWIAQTSRTLSPGHPEKVLMMRHDFISNASSEAIRLIAALLDACAHCASPEGRASLPALLAGKRYLNCPEAWLQYGLSEKPPISAPPAEQNLNTVSFYGPAVNEPSAAHASWIINGLRTCGLLQTNPSDDAPLTSSVCASEYYQAACRLRAQQQ